MGCFNANSNVPHILLSSPVVVIFEIVLSKFAFSLDLPKIEKT